MIEFHYRQPVNIHQALLIALVRFDLHPLPSGQLLSHSDSASNYLPIPFRAKAQTSARVNMNLICFMMPTILRYFLLEIRIGTISWSSLNEL